MPHERAMETAAKETLPRECKRRETDAELRNRLAFLVPDGGFYSAEELGNASGKQLDALRVVYEKRSRTMPK